MSEDNPFDPLAGVRKGETNTVVGNPLVEKIKKRNNPFDLLRVKKVPLDGHATIGALVVNNENPYERTDLVNMTKEVQDGLTPEVVQRIQQEKASGKFRTVAGRPWWIATYTEDELKARGLI